MDNELQQARIDLAAALRLAVHFGYHEAIANHFSLAIDDKGERFPPESLGPALLRGARERSAGGG